MTGNEHDGDSEPGRARRPGGAGARSGRGGAASDRDGSGHSTSGRAADAEDRAGSDHGVSRRDDAGRAASASGRDDSSHSTSARASDAADRADSDRADSGRAASGPGADASDHAGSDHGAAGRARDASQLTNALLARHFWGVLTAVDGTVPYAVPVIYGWDGRAAYVLMLPGRKEQLLRAYPRACLTVVEGEDGASVLLRGRAEWVEELSAKMHAADVVRRQMAGRRAPSVRDAARLVRARILRLVPEELLHRASPFGLPD